MSNLPNFALGGLTGTPSASPLKSLTGSPAQALLAQSNSPRTTAGSDAVTSRDGQISQLGDITTSVNLLQQVAEILGRNAGSASASAPLLNLPPSPPMPAPAKPAAVPTDDHGQSNIVFSDSSIDGSLIH